MHTHEPSPRAAGALFWEQSLDQLIALADGVDDALARELKFNPAQPRVPAGNTDGGQWTREGAAAAFDDYPDTIDAVYPHYHLETSSPVSRQKTPRWHW